MTAPLSPDELEQLLYRCRQEIETARGRFKRADNYRWLFSGIDGLHSKPLEVPQSVRGAGRVSDARSCLERVVEASGRFSRALTELQAANQLLMESEGTAGRGRRLGKWERISPQEHAVLVAKQRTRLANGNGFGEE